MTARTITTAGELDALGNAAVVLDHRGLAWQRRGRTWFSADAGEHPVFDLSRGVTVLRDPSGARPESAPVVPVASDAAVEAAARALRIEEVGDSVPAGFAARQWDIGETPREKPMRLARAALTAALPFLEVVPPATREEVAGVLYEQYLVTNMDDGLILADALLARFTITPRTDR